jgi:hypothetical protein
MPSDAFEHGRPVSCLRSYYLRGNAEHLIASACQYKVNFAYDLGEDGITNASTSSIPTYWQMEFPVTMLETLHPPNFDLRIAARKSTDATSATITYALGPASGPQEVTGGQNTEQWFHGFDTTTSTTDTWLFDLLLEWPDVPDYRYLNARKSYAVTENGAQRTAEVIQARLEITIRSTGGGATGFGYVSAIQLRESP